MFIASPQTEVQITAVTDRSFGNNILLYDSKRITLTLGPDCKSFNLFRSLFHSYIFGILRNQFFIDNFRQ